MDDQVGMVKRRCNRCRNRYHRGSGRLEELKRNSTRVSRHFEVSSGMPEPTSGDTMSNFLIVYKRSTGQLIDCRDLGADRVKALRERFERERLAKDDPDLEVVVLGAPSIEALKRTDARYFKTEGELTADLRAAST
jgi:hypothetical protein